MTKKLIFYQGGTTGGTIFRPPLATGSTAITVDLFDRDDPQ